MSERATIFDVARRANVSITTVSHVFSGKRTIAAATRERVLQAARDLDYVASRAGRALATGRTFTIAVLLPNPLDLCLVNPAFSELILTITEACSVAGYGVLVFGTSEDTVSDDLREAVERRNVDGILWIDPPARDDALARYLRQGKVPLVVGGTPARADLVLHVRNDRHQVARLALTHLAALGRREVAFLIGPRHLMAVHDYVSAFRDVAAELDVGVTLEVAYTASWTITDGRDAMGRLLGVLAPPLGVVAMTEPLAIGALQAAPERGALVPDDIAVVSIGNSHLAGHFAPAITAVDVHTRETGLALVRVLLHVIDGRRPSSPVTIIPASLVVRETTRLPPAPQRSGSGRKVATD